MQQTELRIFLNENIDSSTYRVHVIHTRAHNDGSAKSSDVANKREIVALTRANFERCDIECVKSICGFP
jgi:hypothetical protein